MFLQGVTSWGLDHIDSKLQEACGVSKWKKQLSLHGSQDVSPMVPSPNPPKGGENNVPHNLESIRLGTTHLQDVWCTMHVGSIVHAYLDNISTPTFWMYSAMALHMYYASFWSLIMLIVLKNKSWFEQTSMIFNKRLLLTLSHPSEQIVAPYLWIEFK
jgi:hypothetical protein